MTTRRWAGAAAAIALLASAAGAVSGQTNQGTADGQLPVFGGVVEVNLVNLFVVVSDRDGNPIVGLGRDDFEVREDGVPVEITNFEAVAPASANAPSGGALAPQAPATTAPAVSAPANQHSYLAILIDNPSLQRRDRRRVIGELGPTVDRLLEGGTEVMVAAADRELRIVQGFSASPSDVRDALGRLADTRSDGDALISRKRLLERDIYRAQVVVPGTEGFSQVQAQRYLSQIEALRAQELQRVETALANLGELVRTLAGVEGRTSILWVGQDLPLQPATELYSLLYSRFSGETSLDPPETWGTEAEVVEQVRAVAGLAQGAAIAISFLDAADPDRLAGTADLGATDGLSAVAAEGGERVATMGYDFSGRRTTTEGERYLAGSTGGDVLAGTRNVSPFLDRVVDMMESYYSIGYTRKGEPNHELRDLEVRVRRPGARVRTQERVRSVAADERLGDVALARLQLDAGGNELGLTLGLGTPRASDRRRGEQRELAIVLPASSLVTVPVDGGAVAQLAVAIRILDAAGVPSRPQVNRGQVGVPDGAERLEFGLPLLIPGGTRRIAVAVRDQLSGEIGSAAIAVSD